MDTKDTKAILFKAQDNSFIVSFVSIVSFVCFVLDARALVPGAPTTDD
jgi:hypothetical protein